jgi:hypothetical protein
MKKNHSEVSSQLKSEFTRLPLNRETVRLLTSRHLDLVAAGAVPITERPPTTEPAAQGC